LVKALAGVFRMARDGQLQSFVGTGFGPPGRVTISDTWRQPNVWEMRGAIAWLQDEYVDSIGRAKTPPDGRAG
jgi:hypothetical protein